MKKSHVKKVLRKRLKSWNIGDYVRQFSIVTGGVLLTLWLSARIAEASKQREVQQAMQLVALEMLKTSGLTAYIADKQQVIDLLRCYNRVESFDSTIALYFDLRKETLLGYDSRHPKMMLDRSPEGIALLFGLTISDESIRNWICSIPRSFDEMFFRQIERQTAETIARLERRYGTASEDGQDGPSGQQQK